MVRGGPYAPIGEHRTEVLLSLLNLKPGEKAVDIGSGDGRIVIALAKAGAEAHGYEINPLLVWIARRNVKKAGLTGKAFIHWADMWQKNFSEFDVITLYITGFALRSLEKKLQKEGKKGLRVATNHFTFPTWKPAKRKEDAYLYILK